MEPILDLKGLFVEQLQDRYDSEVQQIEALPKMLQRATSVELKNVIEVSIEHSRRHVKRLEHLFKVLHATPLGELCEGTIGLIHEAWELMKRAVEPEILDAAIITSIQHIHHHDTAGYLTAVMYAKGFGNPEMVHLLESMLEDERDVDIQLTRMMEEIISMNYKKAKVIE